MRFALIVVTGLVVAFAGTTWWALESGGVAIIETTTSEGTVRRTHVWYVEPQGALWLEAGTPENGWFQDVRAEPTLTFSADRRSGRYVAQPLVDPSGHDWIRSLMREKYGLRDRWIGLVFDTLRSRAVQLVPTTPSQPRVRQPG